MRRRVLVSGLVWIVAAIAACNHDRTSESAVSRRYGLGRPATSQDIAARDVDVGPDGAGMPAGSGTTEQGEAIFAQKCASCHGPEGEGKAPLYPRLIGRDPAAEGFVFARQIGTVRTIGNYWPYATTVFDYVRRAMPQTAPGSLTNDEVYALTAYLLSANQVIPVGTSLDSASLRGVKMPYVARFVPDNRRGGREIK